MGGQIQAFSESIDDVLTAVQETPRGRWFLEAYAARIKADGTTNILGAIAKLEGNLERLSISGASAELLEKARKAIATAREEIANLEPDSAKLSSEAQLFSNLAELSRNAFSANPQPPAFGKGVERALRLVADLDRDLNQKTTEFAPPPKPTAQYFKQDEEIFEPAPAKPSPIITMAPELPEPTNKGAKLTIRKLAGEVPKIETEAAPSITISPIAETPVEPSRIVIIRRKANEVLAVPLVDAEASPSPVEGMDAA